MSDSIIEQLKQLSTRGIALVVVVIAVFMLRGVARRRIATMETKAQLSPTMAVRLRLAATWGSVLVGGLLVLQITGVFEQAWAVLSATLAALAVGFIAIWSVLSNMTSALLLLLYGPFRIGDEIELIDTNGTVVLKGKVVDMNLMFTTLQDRSSATRIPNNIFLQKLVRVQREGAAPNPSEDANAPFFDQASS